MAYNPYSAVNAIYNLKGQWDNADKAGDTATKKSIATKAQEYYKQLSDNGYGDVADQLTASNYAQAKSINDKWAKMGKTSTRDYLYSLGQSKGMTQSDVDKLIGWDNDTKQLSFGGKVVGSPDSIVDGVSYWGDTSVLDNAFNDYIKRSGTTLSDSQLQAQHNTEIQQKMNDLWGIQKNDRNAMGDKFNKLEETAYSNPFESAEAKAILAKYDLAGLQGRDNAVASGSASNGGNIDSFASANAMRQQAALTNQGQMAVLEAHNNKLNNVKGILESLGVYQQNQDIGMQNTIGIQQEEAQRLFENDETAKNNDVARKSEIASVTGYVPDEWTYENNIYLNSDGTVKSAFMSTEFDSTGGFTTIINNAQEKLKTTTDPKERANLEATIAQATQAKALKTLQNPAYAKYAHEVSSTAPQQTETGRQFDENNSTVRRSLETELEGKKYEADAAKDASIYAADAEKDASVYAADKATEASNYAANAERESTIYQSDTQKEINDANNKAAKELLEYEALLSGGGSNVFSDDDIKEVDKVVKMINDECKKASVTKNNPEEINIIAPAVNGTYKFIGTPNSPEAKYWRWQIIPIIYNSGLTDVQAAKLYSQLGFTGVELEEVFTKKGWK